MTNPRTINAPQVVAHISDWLRQYCDDAGSEGFVVGVSGGIDSAVTSSLAARTGKPVLCLEIPIHQSENQVSRARKHIDRLEAAFGNVHSQRVDLTPLFDTFVDSMPPIEDRDLQFHSLANTRARLRMTTLYHFATVHRYLVAGTGNKVEDFGVGFYTKYGDGGVDLSPIADLMKSEVYALAAELDVISEIQEAAPTDGLWGDDRTDEDQIGASYPELEWAMTVDGDASQTISGRQQEVLDIYRRLHQANQHKMLPIPVCEVPDAVKYVIPADGT